MRDYASPPLSDSNQPRPLYIWQRPSMNGNRLNTCILQSFRKLHYYLAVFIPTQTRLYVTGLSGTASTTALLMATILSG